MRLRRLVPLVSALVLAGTALTWGVARAQEAERIAGALASVRNAAADRDLAAVREAVNDLQALDPGLDALDESALLLGKTYLAAKQPAEATDAVGELLDRPDGAWHTKALYLAAQAAAERREWRSAADIYARQVEWADSKPHRYEVAQLYREIADGAYLGDIQVDGFGRETRVPDWRTAHTYYARSRSIALADEDRVEVGYRIGKSLLEMGNASAADSEWSALLERGAGDRTDDTLYGRGLAQMRMNRLAEARATFTKLREEHGDSEFASLALIRTGESWVQGGRNEETLRQALVPWRRFLELYPKHDEAPGLALRIPAEQAAVGRLRDAAQSWRAFRTSFPDHEQGPVAQDRIAHAHLQLLEFDTAIKEWQVLLETWPSHELWAQAQRNVALASFRKGEHAFEKEENGPAKAALASFLEAFPVDARAPAAQRLIGEIEARAERHQEAVAAWTLVTSKYPQSNDAPAAALRIAGTWEGPLADLEKALAAYEDLTARWPGSAEARVARTILGQMKGKTLEFTVPRALRTDEATKVAVRLRNTPRLTMKAYRVDPVEYAAKKGGLAGVENVEVDIVKPDHQWDWDVPDFEKYRLLERDCPLPVKGPGAYIVTAAEEELTATFLVVISDLTAIVKSAPDQALVFVFDERTGRPAPGVRVRLLDGDVRGVTGQDGVWRSDGKAVGNVRAIVSGDGAHEGHFAFTAGQAGSATAFGYSTKVLLHTDRPLYRPGDTVNLRGIVRRVAAGRYVTPENHRLRLVVTDPRGAQLLDREVRTDAFGIVAHELELTGEPALGTYTAQTTLDGRTFTQTFDVEAYKKPDMLISVKPGKSTYLVGDEVEAKVELRYRVGGAVKGANVQWTVVRGPFEFDPSVHESFSWFFRDAKRDEERRRRESMGQRDHARGNAMTDEKGQITVTFRPDVVEEDRTYTLVVMAQDPNRRWVRSSAGVPVTRKGAYVICRTEQKVYRPRESVGLEVTVVNPLHVPLQVDGEAVLLRRRQVGQHFVEDEVARKVARTGTDGRVTVQLTAGDPGDYVARFETKDARDNLVVGSTPVTLAGEAEDLAKQAKLVADKEFYREGDVAKVLVNVPVAPSPVLLTYEGERVLEHRVVMVTERSTTVDLPLSARDAPNVFLRMAVARDGQLYEDGDEVAVFRYLDVAVKADKDAYRPGDPVVIEVTTTDQSGKPVEAAVSVDVVDAAIYQLALDGTPQVKSFFYDQRRTHAVTTASSAGPALPAVTKPTNKDLLFEQMRRLGKKRFEEMKEYVQRARDLMRQGNSEAALKEVAKALDIAPGNYDARVLLDSLEQQQRIAGDKSKKLADLRRAVDDPVLKDAKSGGSRPAARKPMAPGADAESADRFDGNAPFEGPATGTGAIGIGGGGGGAFGGRRGGKRAESKNEKGMPNDDVDVAELEELSSRRAREQRGLADFGRSFAKEPNAMGAVFAAQQRAPLVPAELRQRFLDTAVSRPAVRTGPDGKGRLEFELPDNLSEWRITARGSGAESLVGEGRSSFVVRKRILIRADLPRFLVEGDSTTGTGTVHSNLDQEVDGTVRFAATGLTVKDPAEVVRQLLPGQVDSVDVQLASGAHGLRTFEASVLTSIESDAAKLPIPVIPYGVRELSGASGFLAEEAFAKLHRPETTVDGTVSLTVTLAPSGDLALLESLAYTASYPYGCVEQTVNRFLPAVAAREALPSSGTWNQRLVDQIDRSVARGLAALYSLQRDDGSFGWFGSARRGVREYRSNGDVEFTAYALLGMVRAERAGFSVSRPNRDGAIAWLKQNITRGSVGDQTFALYALSFAGQADLEHLNRLHRGREQMDVRSLALLALAMHRTGRPGNALDCVRHIERKVVREGEFAHWDKKAIDARYDRWLRRIPVNVEPTAYALLALAQVTPESGLIGPAARWIAAHKQGPAWRSTRDTAVAIEALATHLRIAGVQRASGDVRVFLNDGTEPVATASFGGDGDRVDAAVTVQVPVDALVAGENRLILRRSGAGEVQWSALLASVVKPKDDGPIAAHDKLVRVTRKYVEWVRPRLPGEGPYERIVPGWSVVQSKHRPAGWDGRPLRRVGTSDKVRVHLSVRPYQTVQNVILTDPIPAGFEVVPGSAQGGFDREERRDTEQVFFFSRVGGTTSVSYVLQAIHPGSYRALPASARPMYEPEIHGWSKERRFTIEEEPGLVGAPPSADEITPDEIWALALRAYAEKDWAAARQGIEALVSGFQLTDGILEEAHARLFVIGLELGDDRLAVTSYEKMLELNPRRRPTDLRLRRLLAGAFQGLDEHERALVLYRDLVRELYELDRQAAEAYAAVGNPWRRVELLSDALRKRPDSEWVAAAELQLARDLTSLRSPLPVATAGDGQPATRTPGTSEGQPLLLNRAVRRLRAFQAHHAASPLAHEAGYLGVQSLVRMRQSDEAIAEGARFLVRFRTSRYLDDVTYLVSEGHFQKQAYDEALSAARPLLDGKFPDDRNPKKQVVSPFRSKAIHLTAKIAHLRGDLDQAVGLYGQVRRLFPDAADAHAFLTSNGLELREVESVAVGETPKLHLRRKNVPEVRLKAYAVDFMILYALRRNLSAVNKIDLAGVAPAHEWVVQRRGKEDYRWNEQTVDLPVGEKGVYLVVASGGGLDASSVVLVSDLEVSIQQTGGRLRVYATNRRTGAPWGEVYVKVGNGREIKAQGFTDARGVFEAGNVGGSFSVVAESDGHTALWRR